MKTLRLFTALLVLACATVAQAQPKQNGFSVILLVGDTQAGAGGDALPPAPGVRKALADVKDFLPYKSYRVLDTQWMRTGSTRMKGPDEQEYEVEVADVDVIIPNPVNPPKAGTLRVAFKLQEAGAAMNSSEEYGRSIQAAELEKQLASLRAMLPSAQGAMLQEQKARIERAEKQLRMVRARKLIDSQFEMAVGETVVVGTSKIGGDKGLVVLLTSVTTGGK
jgi:hypothetical protein